MESLVHPNFSSSRSLKQFAHRFRNDDTDGKQNV